MIIDRVMIKSSTIKEIQDFARRMFQFTPKNISDERNHAENNYPDSTHVVADILGLRMEFYIYQDASIHDADDFRTALRLSKTTESQKIKMLNTSAGRCISAVEGFLFDSDPLHVNDLVRGMEFTVGEMLANFTVFGIKNYLSMMDSSGIDLDGAISWAREEVDLSHWIVMRGEDTPFLVQKSSLEGLSIPKISGYYKLIEKDRLDEGGIGFEVREMDKDMTFDDFKKMMGL
jgi:hypothetical protein